MQQNDGMSVTLSLREVAWLYFEKCSTNDGTPRGLFERLDAVMAKIPRCRGCGVRAEPTTYENGGWCADCKTKGEPARPLSEIATRRMNELSSDPMDHDDDDKR
jgi:hypothetical protein